MLGKSIPQNANTQLSHSSSLLSLTNFSRNKPVPEDRLCCGFGPEQTCATDFGLNFIIIGAFNPADQKGELEKSLGPGGRQ